MTTRVIEILSMEGRDFSASAQLVKREFSPIDSLKSPGDQDINFKSATMESFQYDPAATKLIGKIFQRAIHDCPLCGAELIDSPVECPHCRCNVHGLNQLLGNEGPNLERIMDYHDLIKGSPRPIEKAISRIEKNSRSSPYTFAEQPAPQTSSPPSWPGGCSTMEKNRQTDPGPVFFSWIHTTAK